MSEVTRILNKLDRQDPKAADQILPLVYEELRQLASYRMANEKPGQTLQATALVHEAYLRLVGDENQQWDHRGHFFAAAGEAMRRILVDKARKKLTAKRGGDFKRIDIADIDLSSPDPDEKMLIVTDALDDLALEDPVKAEVVKLHFFAGFTHAETANALNISEKTARRYWTYAKAWLFQRFESQSVKSVWGQFNRTWPNQAASR